MSGSLSVLVVDDVEDQRELLRTHLERAGCRVSMLADTSLLHDTVAAVRPDVAIVDLLMPKADGWAVLDELRATSPSTTLVVASVLDEVDYPRCDDALPKPFSGADVRALVRRIQADRA